MSETKPSSAIVVWSILAILILIAGIVLIRTVYHPQSQGEFVIYNNFEFEHREGLWWSLWQRGNVQYILSLRYNPLQTLNVSVSGKISPEFERDKVYVTFDPAKEDQAYVALAAAELSLNLARALGVDVIAACIANETADCASRPIVNCASANKSVIVINELNTTAKVVLQNECITLAGNELELVRAVDRVLYTFYGIIPSLSTNG